jgi:hypothetical protein
VFGFEQNQGQHEGDLRFVGRVGSYELQFLDGGVDIVRRVETSKDRPGDAPPGRTVRTSRLGLRFDGGAEPRPAGVDLLPGRSNYYVGPRETWRVGVPRYRAIRYAAVYPGVDVLFFEEEGRLKYDFEVAPFASLSAIRLRFVDALEVRLARDGALAVSTVDGEFVHWIPRSFQRDTHANIPVAARFVLLDGSTVGIDVEGRDQSLPLVIDPVVGYGTYLGGNGFDYTDNHGLQVDSAGHLYLSGHTDSWTGTLSGRTSQDGFVVKIDPTLSSTEQILYVTYFGGSAREEVSDIYVDSSGRAFIAGATTSLDFLPQNPGCGARRAYYVRLSSSGLLAGGASLQCDPSVPSSFSGIAADSGGAVFAVGGALAGSSPQPVFPPTHPSELGATLARFAPDDTLTHLGQLGEVGRDIAVGPDGSVYVFGRLLSTGDWITFASRVSANLQQIEYVSFLTSLTWGQHSGGLALDPSGDLLVAHHDGDMYGPLVVTKLDSGGGLLWDTTVASAEVGGYAHSVAVDGAGSVYVVGTGSTFVDPFTPALHPLGNGVGMRLRSDSGAVEWATPFDNIHMGGLFTRDVGVDADRNVYFYGISGVPTPLIHAGSGGFQLSPLGNYDLFLVQVRDDPPIRILPETTRWKPQRSEAPIAVVFQSPLLLSNTTHLEIKDPAGVPVTISTEGLECLECPPGGPYKYRMVWIGPWAQGGDPLPRGNYSVRVRAFPQKGGSILSPAYDKVSLVEVTRVELCQDTAGAVCLAMATQYPGVSSDNPPMDKVPGQDPPQIRPGGGKRIFAEATTPGGLLLNRVKVRATIDPIIQPDPAVPPSALTVPVRFASFDVDDPAPQAPDMDGDQGGVYDNLALPRGCLQPPACSQNSPVTVAAGEQHAVITFSTSSQPGDNYRIVASTSETWLTTVSASPFSVSGQMNLPSSDQAKVSEMLTVWRTLNVEVDSMPPPPPTVYAERNFLIGDIIQINRAAGPSPGVIDLQPEPIAPLSLNDGSTNLDSMPPGPGRFENGTLTIGTGPTAITIVNLEGNGDSGVVEDLYLTPPPIRCMLQPPNSEVATTREVLSWDAKTRRFGLSQAVGPDYDEGTLTLAGNTWQIESVAGTQVEVKGSVKPRFRLIDDDPDPAPLSLAPSTSLVMESDLPMQNAFAQAYVRPRYWASGAAPPFQRNVRCDSASEIQCPYSELQVQLGLGREVPKTPPKTPKTTPTFWGFYVQGAFQGDQRRDGDGYNELVTGVEAGMTHGLTDEYGSAVYFEVIDDLNRRDAVLREKVLSYTLVHELGHQFGFGDNTGAIMTQNGTERFFTGLHLNGIRRKGLR